MKNVNIWILSVATLIGFACTGCIQTTEPKARSGVSIAAVHIEAGSDGLTAEQRNVKDRLTVDNKPGSIKHLYIISAYSGDVLIYSTVKGKVTSSGKRLSPHQSWHTDNGHIYRDEALQDDGTYGSSVEYLYWFDSKGIYHQHYPAGGQIIHLSNEPLAVKKVIINMEHSRDNE